LPCFYNKLPSSNTNNTQIIVDQNWRSGLGLSWLWSYGSWIYNYLCKQCLSPLMLWVWILLSGGVFDTTLCDKVCQWLATGQWFSSCTLFSSTNKADHHDITEILLKVALNTINHQPPPINYLLVTAVINESLRTRTNDPDWLII
jgi:hypothetical protein